MDEQDDVFDAIVVGGGLAGLSAAYTLAESGRLVLLLERGDYCGAKNVTGGRIYVAPIRDMLPGFWEKAPLERPIVSEEICVMGSTDSVLVKCEGESYSETPYRSYSICRGKFDKYFAKQAARKGVEIVTKSCVKQLIIEDGSVKGVIVDGEELRARVVILAEGVLGLLAEQAGLRDPNRKTSMAVGVKETIELDPSVIEERLCLEQGMGAARLFMGDCTAGRFGGGFMYTNNESIALGLVLGIDAQGEANNLSAPEMLERFKKRPEVSRLIRGGNIVEYSAHAITEAGYGGIQSLYGDGVVVVGEAAGLALNGGLVVRGMEYAIASGYYAAKAIDEALDSNDCSSDKLRRYQEMLESSFVMADFSEYETVPKALDYQRFFTYYPELVAGLMADLFAVENGPKQRIYPTIKRHLSMRDLSTIAFNDLRRIKRL